MATPNDLLPNNGMQLDVSRGDQSIEGKKDNNGTSTLDYLHQVIMGKPQTNYKNHHESNEGNQNLIRELERMQSRITSLERSNANIEEKLLYIGLESHAAKGFKNHNEDKQRIKFLEKECANLCKQNSSLKDYEKKYNNLKTQIQEFQKNYDGLLAACDMQAKQLEREKNENANLRSQLVTADGQVKEVTIESIFGSLKAFESKVTPVLFKIGKTPNICHDLDAFSKAMQQLFNTTSAFAASHVEDTMAKLGHLRDDKSQLCVRNRVYVRTIIIANLENSGLMQQMCDEVLKGLAEEYHTNSLFSHILMHLPNLVNAALLLALVEPQVATSFKLRGDSIAMLKDFAGSKRPIPILPAIDQVGINGDFQPTKMVMRYIN
ncbi:hypothetical protein K7432_004905 [Basidiobolus ranarum]|uniref:FRIGIDA-like protein n=1 Tax=Basidiobolus ranarum TaxID=34480 RepID=A0ABR2WXK2_9FUNG